MPKPKFQSTSALRELLARREAINAKRAWLDTFFPQQRAFVTSREKTLAALCSRRAGKSIGNAGRLILAAEEFPGEMSAYVALTKNNARMIVGRALMDLSRKFDLGLRLKEIDQRLTCIHPNGHYIWLAGAKNRVDFEQFRGYKFAEVQVDEAQLYGGWLREVVEDILEPSVGDLDGAIALTGTPSPLPIGYFHSITTGEDVDEFGSPIPQWETYHWTVAQNTFFRPHDGGGQAWRDRIRIRRGWQDDHPTFQREYHGRWVKDVGALVYPLDFSPGPNSEPGRNAYYDLPKGGPPWEYVIGVDVGFTDDTAFVVMGFQRGKPEIYVVEAYAKQNFTPARTATHLLRLKETYNPRKIVIDAAARGYIEEFKTRYGIACEGSEKQNKVAFASMLRGDILSGVVKYHRRHASELIEQCAVVQWKEDHTGIDERFEDDLCFVAGTQIALADGTSKAIEDVRPGEWVVTSAGPREVADAACTGVKEVWRVETATGLVLEGTGNHPVFVNGVKTPIEELRCGDELCVLSDWHGADESGDGIQTHPSGHTEFTGTQRLTECRDCCIASSGSNFVAPFHKGGTSIIRMGTRATTISKTWSACRRVLTCLRTCGIQCARGLLQSVWPNMPDRLQACGIGAPPAVRGIAGPQLLCGTKRLNCSITLVPSAIGPSRHELLGQRSVPTTATPRLGVSAGSTTRHDSVFGAEHPTKPTATVGRSFAVDRVTRVVRTRNVRPVYNLTVSLRHEYFANGILVANCDAMLYCWRAIRTHYRPELEGYAPGSPEWINQNHAKHKESLVKAVDQRLRKSWMDLAQRVSGGRKYRTSRR